MHDGIKIMDGQDPNRPDTYWSIGFRTARTGFFVKYVLASMMVMFFFVICPLFIYAPEFFSISEFGRMSDSVRAEFWAKARIVILLVSIPFCLSIAILIVGQIRRFHDFNKPGWLCVLNIVLPASLGIILLLLAVPGTHGPNRYGEDPHDRRKREAAEFAARRIAAKRCD